MIVLWLNLVWTKLFQLSRFTVFNTIFPQIPPPLSTFALSLSITFEIFQKIAEGGPTDDSQNQQILQAELTQLSSEKIKVYCLYKFVVLYFFIYKKSISGKLCKILTIRIFITKDPMG